MRKDDTVYLSHILEAIDKIAEYLDDVDYKTFSDNNMMKRRYC